MKIRYLKTTEEFELVVPDPIGSENDTITVRISDYDLVVLLNSSFETRGDIDDDTFLGIKKLCENWNLSIRTLKLAKTQQHLRQLNRVASSWVELTKKERKPRQAKDLSEEDLERIQYLTENYDKIAMNCARHDWFQEFMRLCKDIDRKATKEDIKAKWKELRKNVHN